MITAGDFRKGATIEWEGGVWTIVDFQHVKPGKGAAFVRTKLKNVMTGAVVERSFNPTDKQPRATIEIIDNCTSHAIPESCLQTASNLLYRIFHPDYSTVARFCRSRNRDFVPETGLSCQMP